MTVVLDWQDELVAIVAGAIAGARYGVKIRLPHAAVMTTLFGSPGNSLKKLQRVLASTLEHAGNLGSFVALYKTVLLLLKVSYHASGSRIVDPLYYQGSGSKDGFANLNFFLYSLGQAIVKLLGTIDHIFSKDLFWRGFLTCILRLVHSAWARYHAVDMSNYPER
jgi:hypothetical protein